MSDCSLCKNVNTIQSGSGSKMNNQMVRIGGICLVYKNGINNYVKKCCLVKLYLGSSSSTYSQDKLFNIIKIKAPKYVITNDDKYIVYEIKLKTEEVIVDPNGFNDNNKLEIQRFITLNNHTESYEFITKTKFDNPNIKNMLVRTTNNKECNNFQYIYLIQERTAVAINKPIYKIGRTSQLNFERFKSYGKGYKILLHVVCDNCIDIETKLINSFKYKYIHRNDYGNEYFEGDYKLMIKDIFEAV